MSRIDAMTSDAICGTIELPAIRQRPFRPTIPSTSMGTSGLARRALPSWQVIHSASDHQLPLRPSAGDVDPGDCDHPAPSSPCPRCPSSPSRSASPTGFAASSRRSAARPCGRRYWKSRPLLMLSALANSSLPPSRFAETIPWRSVPSWRSPAPRSSPWVLARATQ